MIRRLFRAEFIRFGIVGVVGLLVDIAVLYLCLDISGLGLYASRVVSYLAAATTTWALSAGMPTVMLQMCRSCT